MKKPADHPIEERRLELSESLHLVYSLAEERFDRLTRLATRHFDVPIALVSLVSGDRQWFKSSQGIIASETSREVSFCGHAILREDALVINDTQTDSDFVDNPLVVENPQIRFYAGHPLRYDDIPLGTLCLIDRKPRKFSEDDRDSLETLAVCVEAELRHTQMSQPEEELLSQQMESDRRNLIDPVTQSWNQSSLNLLLAREIDYPVRTRKSFALLAIRFTTAAHEFDELDESDKQEFVRRVAQGVRSALRPHDMIARTSENQLVVFAPNCNSELSEHLVGRVFNRISDSPVKAGSRDIKVDVNAGIAVANSRTTPEHLLDIAGKALNDSVRESLPQIKYLL
ncbi:MAG TPA: GGDEF domain-containing protein [Gammaproteobacteria bacterium]|nr:GGDEF domain-containing protein [Gammaproteobacteria bacterium]